MTDTSASLPSSPGEEHLTGYKMKVTEGLRHDSKCKRGRVRRWLLLTTATVLIVGVPLSVGYTIGSYLGVPWTGTSIGTLVGGILYSYILPEYLLVTVEILRGFVTQNIFSGQRIPYGPGWHPALPWESRAAKGNFPLDLVTMETFVEEIPVKNGQAKVTVSLQYMADLAHATNFVGIDESTIKGGFSALIKSYLSNLLAEVPLDEAKKSIGIYNSKLASTFMTLEMEANGSDDAESSEGFEQTYGILIVVLTIEGIDFPEGIQRTRDAQDKAEQQLIVVAKLYGLEVDVLQSKLAANEIPLEQYKTMLDDAMALSGNATKTVKSFHGLKGSGASVLIEDKS